MPHEREKVSRREFFKAGLGGGVFLAEIFSSKKALAALEKLLTTKEFIDETFEEGLNRLRQDVFEKKQERFFAFIQKNKKSGWLNIEDVMTEDAGQSMELSPILEDTKIDSIHFVHTHPIHMAELDRLLPADIIAEARKNKKTNFPLLPSSTDIMTLIKQKLLAKEQNMPYELKYSVLDPGGIWDYDIDFLHPKIKEIARELSYEMARKKTGNAKTEEELMVVQPHEAAGITLWFILQEKQQDFYRDLRGITADGLIELKNWAQKEWGIILNFRPYQSSLN